MTQDRPGSSRPRTIILPLVVALPVFFALFALAEGFYILGQVERLWNSGGGNVWQAIQSTYLSVWLFSAFGAAAGIGWAVVILRPIRRSKAQLDRLIEEGRAGELDIDPQSDLSALIVSFNRVMHEMGTGLPRRAQSVLDAISSGVIFIDSEGVVDWANPMAGRLFETPIERMKMKSYREVFVRSDKLVEMIDRCFERGTETPQETVILPLLSGGKRVLGVRLAWVKDAEERPFAIILSALDLSRLEAFTSGVRSAERLSSLAKIAAGIAHEVRNPLASIRGLSQLLAESDEVKHEKVVSYSNIIVGEVDRVNHVVDRLSQLVSTQDQERESTPIRYLFEAVVDLSGHLARRRRVHFEVETPPDEWVVVVGRRQMVQALLNLVINGIEAANEGGRVQLRARLDGEQTVAIDVENDGTGIPSNELDDLFQPFHTTKEQGTGLGLVIAESVVTDHGGRVAVQSGTNCTVFTVFLPLDPSRRPDVDGPEIPVPVDDEERKI